MFNNSLFNEETRLKIAEREREAETYRVQKQLGYGERGSVRWILGLLMLVAVLLLIPLLF